MVTPRGDHPTPPPPRPPLSASSPSHQSNHADSVSPPTPQGLELTSPVVAAALQPAVPVFTGALAVALGSERVSFRRRDGWAKLLGSALVVTGALVTGASGGGRSNP